MRGIHFHPARCSGMTPFRQSLDNGPNHVHPVLTTTPQCHGTFVFHHGALQRAHVGGWNVRRIAHHDMVVVGFVLIVIRVIVIAGDRRCRRVKIVARHEERRVALLPVVSQDALRIVLCCEWLTQDLNLESRVTQST